MIPPFENIITQPCSNVNVGKMLTMLMSIYWTAQAMKRLMQFARLFVVFAHFCYQKHLLPETFEKVS